MLFLIQQNTYQDALRQAEGQILLQKAQLDYAEKQLVRYSNLLQQKATSQENVDNWRYQRDSAQANLKVGGSGPRPGQTQSELHGGHGSLRRPDRPQAERSRQPGGLG